MSLFVELTDELAAAISWRLLELSFLFLLPSLALGTISMLAPSQAETS